MDKTHQIFVTLVAGFVVSLALCMLTAWYSVTRARDITDTLLRKQVSESVRINEENRAKHFDNINRRLVEIEDMLQKPARHNPALEWRSE